MLISEWKITEVQKPWPEKGTLTFRRMLALYMTSTSGLPYLEPEFRKRRDFLWLRFWSDSKASLELGLEDWGGPHRGQGTPGGGNATATAWQEETAGHAGTSRSSRWAEAQVSWR